MSSIGYRRTDDGIVLSYRFDESQFGSFLLDPKLSAIEDISRIGIKVVISKFNDLYIGDLAFLAMLIGMNNSSGKHCIKCMATMNEFNCEHDDLVPRTKQKLEECLIKYMEYRTKTKAKKPKANYKGVNKKPLLDIDPSQICIPILHCPMGLVDKVLESFKSYVNNEVERLSPDAEAKRQAHLVSINIANLATESHRSAKELLTAEPTNQEVIKLEAHCKKAMDTANKKKDKAKEDLAEAVKCHNALKVSLVQQFEKICRQYGIGREHYHGGELLFIGDENEKGGFLEECLRLKRAEADEAGIRKTCKDYARMMGLLDVIWSKVRGTEAGLLPTPTQAKELDTALDEGKKQWLHMILTTQQPKWHMTFDGHLAKQYSDLGGLADKADDTMEAFHQVLKKLRGRFRGTRSYMTKENCIRRELRRQRCPKIARVISNHEKKIKQSSGTKRKQEAESRQKEAKRIKTERRMAVLNNNNNNN